MYLTHIALYLAHFLDQAASNTGMYVDWRFTPYVRCADRELAPTLADRYNDCDSERIFRTSHRSKR